MNRPIFRAGLAFGTLGFGLLGCQGAPKQPEPTVKKATSDDPTAWSSTAISKGESDDDATSAAGSPKSIFKPSGLSGAMSSQGADIEKSLGIK